VVTDPDRARLPVEEAGDADDAAAWWNSTTSA
jgi:hypothetical protein